MTRVGFERPFSFMYHFDVGTYNTRRCIAFMTNIASLWLLLLLYYCNMFLQVCCTYRFMIARVTTVSFYFFMNMFNVCFQDSSWCEILITNVALPRFFSLMTGWHMLLQVFFIFVTGIAKLTLIVLLPFMYCFNR